MYTGTNPSALRSREWFCNALLRLLETRKYEEITVKDICREADLSRQTFYQIYDSKEEVMTYHFHRLFAAFSAGQEADQINSVRHLARHFFSFFYENRAFVGELIENNMTYVLERQFENYLPQIALFTQGSQQEAYPDYSVAFIAGALTQLLVHWREKGYAPDIDALSAVTEGLLMRIEKE